MSDIYELAKSEQPQDMGEQSPYESMQWNYINDINSGVYTNSQQSLVQIDLQSIYNSGNFIDISKMFIVLPMVYTAAFTTAGDVTVAPIAGLGSEFLITPKSGSWNLIQSIEVMVDGKNVIQQQPNINIHCGFQMLSKMSKSDVDTIGKTIGVYPDDVQSYLFNGSSSALTTTVGPIGGNGLCNNAIFSVGNNGGVATITQPNYNEQNIPFNAFAMGTVYNTALQERSRRIANNATVSGNNFIGANATTSLFSTDNLNNEFRPYYSVNGNYMTWIDYAIIRLGDVCDFFNNAPLSKNFNGLLRIYINTGALWIGLDGPTSGGMYLSQANSSFNNTCPFTINQLPHASIPATATQLAVSCNLVRSSVTTLMNGARLADSAGSNPMNAVRCYFPIVKLKPQLALKYINDNRAKQIVYTNVLSNVFQNIASGNTFSQLVQSGVRNIKGILLVPFMSQAVHGALNTGGAGHIFTTPIVPFSPISSPFDTAPNTTPMSLTQLNVAIGGVNQLMSFYNYTFENYVEQIKIHNNINSSDIGLSAGLINTFTWEQGNRFYYIDCGRASLADFNTPRNVTITFRNNSLQPIDVWSFVEYEDSKVIDVETGMLN